MHVCTHCTKGLRVELVAGIQLMTWPGGLQRCLSTSCLPEEGPDLLPYWHEAELAFFVFLHCQILQTWLA